MSNEMKTLILITAFFCLIGLGVKAQKDSVEKRKTAADLYWETMPKNFQISSYKLPENYTRQEFLLYKESQIKGNVKREMFSRLLREWGIEFWKKFPNDPRRFIWLGSTCIYQPAYFANLREGALAEFEGRFVIPLDTIVRNEWKNLFAQYAKEANGNGQAISYALELSPDYNKKWRNSVTEKFDYKDHLNQVIAYINYKKTQKKTIQERSIDQWLAIRERRDFGLDEQDIRNYINLLKSAGVSEFYKVAQNMEVLLKLEQTPLQLKANSITGEKVDLKQFRGKLVLVDFWHPSCSGCIGMMPEMKMVYDKYKGKGFEVLSASLFYSQYKDELTRVKKVYDKIGADWPLVLLGGNKGEQGRLLFEQYGWYGVPQVLLMDEEGKLIQFNSELRIKGGLERVVKQHFERKAIKNKSGK